ncbi:hypothetical protein SVAN01_06617, partial [Stagonosporopsis vannaccii]
QRVLVRLAVSFLFANTTRVTILRHAITLTVYESSLATRRQPRVHCETNSDRTFADRLYSAKYRRPATWDLMEVHFRYRRNARRCTDRTFVAFTDIGAMSFDQASQLHDISASRLAAPSESSCEPAKIRSQTMPCWRWRAQAFEKFHAAFSKAAVWCASEGRRSEWTPLQACKAPLLAFRQELGYTSFSTVHPRPRRRRAQQRQWHISPGEKEQRSISWAS